MAITYITGIPRSGKSYYAMYLLYKSFIEKMPTSSKVEKLLQGYLPQKKLAKQYDFAYTNINQFDFTQSDKIKPYDYNEIQSKLTSLHAMYIDKKPDSVLIEFAKNLGLYNVLFVIDEAQNFFGKDNVVSTWWFTYHGHLHQDIILITQNLDYIFSNYTKIAEFFYKAVPPSSRFFSNKFRYIQYNSYKLYQKDKIGDFHVPMIPDIFKLYVSGASNNAPSAVKKYLFIGGILIVVVILLFNNFLSMFDVAPIDKNETKPLASAPVQTQIQSKPVQTKQLNTQTQTKIITQNESDLETLEKMLFEISCVDKLCSYKGVDFPKVFLTRILKDVPTKDYFVFQNEPFSLYFLVMPSTTFDFIKIGDKKDAKDKEIIEPSLFPSSNTKETKQTDTKGLPKPYIRSNPDAHASK
jgi:zona occludens toxin